MSLRSIMKAMKYGLGGTEMFPIPFEAETNADTWIKKLNRLMEIWLLDKLIWNLAYWIN